MQTVKLTPDNLKETSDLATKAILNGGLVVIPSDTAYGLAADATSSEAVKKIYDFKGRQFGKGISVFLKSTDDIEKYAELDRSQFDLIKALLPGPFTVILESKHVLARELEAPDGTLGIRVIDHPFIKHLTSRLKHPLTATSANLSGRGPHYSVGAFLATLSDRKKTLIGLVVDAGPLPLRKTSTVIRLAGDEVKVLREGELSLKPLGAWQTTSEEETKKLAQEIFYRFFLKTPIRQPADQKSPTAVILKGNLGTGKTVFAKGIGELFGLKLTSPTFTLIDEYDLTNTSHLRGGGDPAEGGGRHLGGEKPKPRTNNQELVTKYLYHLDLYRLESEAEIAGLRLTQFLAPGNLILIEWGDKLSVFQDLKKSGAALFLLQITDLDQSTRQLSLFKI